jgi:hypothetical protein
MKLKPYVEYWEDILLHLSKLLPCHNATLLEGFWPLSNWRSNYLRVSLLIAIVSANLEDPIQCPYVGRRTWALQIYTPHLKILMMGILFSLGRMILALSYLDEKNTRWCYERWRECIFKMVRVQWWVPMKKGPNMDEWHMYENCWNGKWKCNIANLEQWLDILF